MSLAQFWTQNAAWLAPAIVAVLDYLIAQLHPNPEINNALQWLIFVVKGGKPTVPPPPQG